MTIKVAILCGGNGVRLRPLSFYIQKCMIPIPPLEKPLLERTVHLVRLHGFRDILLLTSYKGEQIMNYFDDGSRFDVRITYVKDKPDVKGSGWSLYNAYLQGEVTRNDSVLIYYGDILSNVDLSSLVSYHEETNAAVTLVTSQHYQIPVGVIQTENGRVKSVLEKPFLEIQAGIGIMVINGSTFNVLGTLCNQKNSVDIMGDFVPAVISRAMNVQAYTTDAFWYDVGSLERYEKLCEMPIPESLRIGPKIKMVTA